MSERSKDVVAGVSGVLGGFRDFLMRGNVVELAVAVVVGTAFTSIVNSVVEGVINPVVGAFGTRDLDAYESCLRGPCEVNEAGEVDGIPIRWGSVVSASLTFLITAAVVYFMMILPMTRLMARRKAKEPAVAPQKTELDILTEIRDELIAQRAGGATIAPQRSGPATESESASEAASGSASPLDKQQPK